jgi:hypothetical protein
MVYTAIYQAPHGKMTYERHTGGSMNRQESWLSAAREGSKNNKVLIALVPGYHEVYFFNDFAEAFRKK